jgi:hypothetical protein
MVKEEQARFADRVLKVTECKAREAGVGVTEYIAGILEGRFPRIDAAEADAAAVGGGGAHALAETKRPLY